MNPKSAVANTAVAIVALLVSLGLCEVVARLVLSPADYLAVTTRPDPALGMTIAPGTAGLDAAGFRNPAVPEAVDVVALGDSHTFGNTAAMEDSWPSVVSRETGLTVYNLGLGGYGPNQYYELLKTRGLPLRPTRVVCALYMGDDFENAFSITYGLDYWASLRAGRWEHVNANIWGDAEPPGVFRMLRDWLSRQSMVYRLVVHGPVLGVIKERLRFNQARQSTDPLVTTIEDSEKNIREAFRPVGIAARLDQTRPEVREGMRITFDLLSKMDHACRESGCAFTVVIIPTKETVFAEYLQGNPQLHLRSAVNAVIADEETARRQLQEFLKTSGIPHVDTLPALREAVSQGLYYPGPSDMHPGRQGYKVIGDVVAGFLRESGAQTK